MEDVERGSVEHGEAGTKVLPVPKMIQVQEALVCQPQSFLMHLGCSHIISLPCEAALMSSRLSVRSMKQVQSDL